MAGRAPRSWALVARWTTIWSALRRHALVRLASWNRGAGPLLLGLGHGRFSYHSSPERGTAAATGATTKVLCRLFRHAHKCSSPAGACATRTGPLRLLRNSRPPPACVPSPCHPGSRRSILPVVRSTHALGPPAAKRHHAREARKWWPMGEKEKSVRTKD